MLAGYELRHYTGQERVWAGKYKSARNLLHWHYDCELIYINEGKTDVSVNGVAYPLEAGQSAFIQSGEVHYILSEPDSVLSMIQFDAKLIERIVLSRRLLSPVLACDYGVSESFERIYRELVQRQPFYLMEIDSEVIRLMVRIFRCEKCGPLQPEPDSFIQQYRGLLEEIDKKYAFFACTDGARFMGQSPHYFSTIFHRTAGVTFTQYLNEVRVEKAVEMLKEGGDISITEVAARCGFGTIRNFNRVFKQITGIPPRSVTKDFYLESKPIKTVRDGFNPTLGETELL